MKADYVGKIPISSGVITLEITIDGEKAVAYACDGNTVEVWLSGSAKNGVLNLANKGNTSRLEGRHEGNAVVGTLSIDQKSWDFKAAAVQAPAGLYVYQDDAAYEAAGSSMRTRASPVCNGRRTDRPRPRPLCSPMELPSSTAGKPP